MKKYRVNVSGSVYEIEVEEMDASATLDGYIINIVPNVASVKQFYSENVNVTENVGLVEMTIIISVTPDTIQVEG